MNSMWTKGRTQADRCVVLSQLAIFIVRDGETRTYTFASFMEESETEATKTSVEVYATTEGGVSMPFQ